MRAEVYLDFLTTGGVSVVSGGWPCQRDDLNLGAILM